MVAFYTAEVAFQGPSNIPRDQFENVFHFSGAGADRPSEAWSICALLAFFYTDGGLGGFSINQYLSGGINRDVHVKVYDEADPKPRPFLIDGAFTLAASGAPVSMPEEIALCLSFFAGRNLPRQRGRVYIGPLGIAGIAGPGEPRPSANMMNAWASEATGMMNTPLPTALMMGAVTGAGTGIVPVGFTPTPLPMVWCVKSSNGGPVKHAGLVDYQPVTGGWVDNEWDGQSRRRVAATSRVTF
jgi:hypothetical protein